MWVVRMLGMRAHLGRHVVLVRVIFPVVRRVALTRAFRHAHAHHRDVQQHIARVRSRSHLRDFLTSL